jgi:hypothetical protein
MHQCVDGRTTTDDFDYDGTQTAITAVDVLLVGPQE